MNRTLFSFLFFMTVLALTISPVIAASLGAEQAERDFHTADAKLNKVYQQILGELKHKKWTGSPQLAGDCVTDFIKGERAWVAFRDAEGELASGVASAVSGHAGAEVTFQRETELTEERVKFLQRFYTALSRSDDDSLLGLLGLRQQDGQ